MMIALWKKGNDAGWTGAHGGWPIAHRGSTFVKKVMPAGQVTS